MRVATMVRGYLPVPRPADLVYAPIDLAMALCEGLSVKGHQVTYYGPKGSKPPARLKSLNLEPLARNYKEFQQLALDTDMHMHYVPGLWDYYYAREMFERARNGEYDLLHFHHSESALPFASLYPDVPVVYTVHDSSLKWHQQLHDLFNSKNQFYVSISDSQRTMAPDLSYIATVYNGLHLKDYEYSEKGGDILLFAGRITPEKGLAEAVQVALKTSSKLTIIGPVFPDTQAYFDKCVKPYLNNDIKYLGYLKREEVASHMKKAKAFLMPIKWEEAFGMTMIEAMATGTPVIAFKRGSVPEIIKNGETGFIVKTVEEMAAAVNKIHLISRKNCRKYVEDNFSVQHMVDNYEQVFLDAINKVK